MFAGAIPRAPSHGIPGNNRTSLAPLLIPDSKAHGANMGPIRDRQDPGGPHVVPTNLAIWDSLTKISFCLGQGILYPSTFINRDWLNYHRD